MKLLSYLKIHTKLASMVCLAALTVTAIIAVSTVLSKSRMMDDRVQQMKAAVDLLHGLAQTFHDDAAAGKMTVDDAKLQFRQRARNMKFGGGQGYPVVYNSDTSILVNGANPQLEGKITGATDSNGVLIADAQLNAARQAPQGGVTSYLYPRPGQTEPSARPCSSASSRPGTPRSATASMSTISTPTCARSRSSSPRSAPA